MVPLTWHIVQKMDGYLCEERFGVQLTLHNLLLHGDIRCHNFVDLTKSLWYYYWFWSPFCLFFWVLQVTLRPWMALNT